LVLDMYQFVGYIPSVFSKNCTYTCQNPHPWMQVQVLTGMGVGCPGKPQGSLWHSLVWVGVSISQLFDFSKVQLFSKSPRRPNYPHSDDSKCTKIIYFWLWVILQEESWECLTQCLYNLEFKLRISVTYLHQHWAVEFQPGMPRLVTSP